jgi:hypothetical protein
MNFDDPKFWLQLGLVVWNIGLTTALWLRKPGEDAGKAVSKLDSDMRVMQETLKHLPTGDEVKKLTVDLAAVKADNRSQTDLLRAVQQQLSRIDDYLRNNH